MLRLKDPILGAPPSANGIESPSLREPESLELAPPYVASAGVTVMTTAELAAARSAPIPPLPGFDRFGERVSHITDRFVLTGSKDAYRIWRFQSARTPVEFPSTEEGWALAWKTFGDLGCQQEGMKVSGQDNRTGRPIPVAVS